MSGGSLLVVDVGTSGLRAAIVRPDATVEHVHHQVLLPTSPAPGFVEFDAAAMAKAALECAQAALAAGSPFLREYFGLPDDRKVVCGISFGYADPDHPTATYRTSRAGLEDVVTFVG
jgi:sugar (pentulose or hexulose) kinase